MMKKYLLCLGLITTTLMGAQAALQQKQQERQAIQARLQAKRLHIQANQGASGLAMARIHGEMRDYRALDQEEWDTLTDRQAYRDISAEERLRDMAVGHAQFRAAATQATTIHNRHVCLALDNAMESNDRQRQSIELLIRDRERTVVASRERDEQLRNLTTAYQQVLAAGRSLDDVAANTTCALRD